MVEVALDGFEEYYKEQLNEIFFKIKRVIKKLLNDITTILNEIKVTMDRFLKAGKEKIDQKSLKSLNLFCDRIVNEIEEIKIPDEKEINFDNLNRLHNSIKKLFTTINEIARKSLPKFQKEVQMEIKELNYVTQKLGKKNILLDRIMRKKYTQVKSAESLLEKIPKLFTLKENIEKSKNELDSLEKEFESKKKDSETQNQQLLELEKNQLFKDHKKAEDDLFKIKLEIDEKLGFKKALKKLRVEIEKENFRVPNLDLNYLKEFSKNPINSLLNDGTDLPKFSGLMVQLRLILEDNKINLKLDKKEKTIDQINDFFKNRALQEEVEKLKTSGASVKEAEKKIESSGLSKNLETIKNQIVLTTVKLEHIESDLNRKNKDYMKYLESLKNEREDFQRLVEEIIQEPIKINIDLAI